MANFNTHLTVAAGLSGLISTLAFKVGYVSSAEALLLVAAGTVGGILPDIDLKYSHPSRILFALLGTIAALLWMFSTPLMLAILELWLLGLGVFLLIRFPLWYLFHRFTVHRGSIHSVAAAALAGLATSVLCERVLGQTPFLAWMTAAFVVIGFLLHLLLDEIFSVDFMDARVKRSFGSALKLIDLQHKIGSTVIVALCAVTLWFAPSTTSFLEKAAAPSTPAVLWERLVPTWLWGDR